MIRIGAGIGRGKWYRHTKKEVQEDVARISIFDLRRAGVLDGALKTGTIGSGRVGFAVQPPFMLLQRKGVNTTIHLTSTKPHLGGKRWWFTCPDCNRRCGVLYLEWGTFACRLCHDLTYESRNRRWLKNPFDLPN